MPELDDTEAPDCRESRHRLALFVERGLPAAEAGDLWAHLRSCPECREVSTRTLESVARVGRSRREARLAAARLARRSDQRRLALAAGSRPRRSWHPLRLVLLPALFAALVLQLGLVAGSGRSDLRAIWERGTVGAGALALGADQPEGRLRPGSSCRTGPGSLARLAGEGTLVHLGERTSVRFEGGGEVPRLRLEGGALTLQGPALVVAPGGAVRVEEGLAEVAWRGSELAVACRTGRLEVTTPLGSESLAGGERRVLAVAPPPP